MPDFDELIEKVSTDFHADPRNKVIAPAELLTASVHEEMGKEISPNDLKEIIHGYQEGDLNGNQEGIYDAAVYCCGVLARLCFADDPDDEDAEVDYEVSWIENQDGSMSGEVRPT